MITNADLSFLLQLIRRLGLTSVPTELRGDFYRLKKELESYLSDIEEEKVIITLMNGGVENKQAGGFVIPEFPNKETFEGKDKEYKKEIERVSNIRKAVLKQVRDLMDSEATIKLPKILTLEQYEDFGRMANVIEWVNLKDALVIE